MEQRCELRPERMPAQAEVSPVAMRGLLTRLDAVVEPFAVSLTKAEQRRHAAEYMTGLLSELERKTGEAIAYFHDQERQGRQKFVGHVPWDHRPLLATLARQVGEDLGEPDAVLVIDPSAFAKRGTRSVGVARQWCGRLGEVENRQVGVFMASASRSGHAIVDVRLYLPKGWAMGRPRRQEAGVPEAAEFRTRQQLAPEMPGACGADLPRSWAAGDGEMGRPAGFRRDLRGRGERYLLGVPSNTSIRDPDVPPPPHAGRGRRPTTPFARLDRWRSGVPEDGWVAIEVRDGEKGPLVIETIKRRVQARTPTGGTGPEELWFVTRERQAGSTFTHDYYSSNAAAEPSSKELARVAEAAHRVEECLERANGEAGWPTTRRGTGSPGTITGPSRCWPRGS